MPDELRLGAVYERSIAASLERLWENVHDWEHLPWVHEGAFSGIELEESGDWGWRARVGLAGGDETLRVELRREPDREVYHTRTLEGPGEGSDTIVRLIPHCVPKAPHCATNSSRACFNCSVSSFITFRYY